MKKFGGRALFLDRSDINTDEIIPAKYLTENSKADLKPYILEDLKLERFDPESKAVDKASVVVTRGNFGCGSSREHAVWVFEVNDINVVIAESFARIFRQNMFNCGLLAIELSPEAIDELFQLAGEVEIEIDINQAQLTVRGNRTMTSAFSLDSFDRDLVAAGGWLSYANAKY